MAKLTLGRMAKLYGLHRSSLYEAVAKGRVSTSIDGKGQKVIDLSEMIRVYGEPPGQARQLPDTPTDSAQTVPTDVLVPLLEELRLLREEVAGLRAELRLLEHKPGGVVSSNDTPRDVGVTEKPAKPVQSFAELLKGLDGE